TERFHYDGVRRVQEVVIDPLTSGGGALASGDPELEALALATVPSGHPAARAAGLHRCYGGRAAS
ncbi:MAG: hypothetical protein KIS87_15005, partial [Phycisphaeraceae bacterium]|nr:hypothetical protein [Phycisphaeraceae bacterium]